MELSQPMWCENPDWIGPLFEDSLNTRSLSCKAEGSEVPLGFATGLCCFQLALRLCHHTELWPWAVCFPGLAFGTSTADSTSGWAGSEFRTVFFFRFSRTVLWMCQLQVGANVLAEELDRVASSFTGRHRRTLSALSELAQMIQCNARRIGTGDVDLHSDCIPGRFSLELLMLLTHPGFNRTDCVMSLVRSRVTLGQLNSCEYPGPFDGVWNASWHDNGL